MGTGNVQPGPLPPQVGHVTFYTGHDLLRRLKGIKTFQISLFGKLLFISVPPTCYHSPQKRRHQRTRYGGCLTGPS